MKAVLWLITVTMAGLSVVPSLHSESTGGTADTTARAIRRSSEGATRSNAVARASGSSTSTVRNPTSQPENRRDMPVEQLLQYLQQNNPKEFERMKKLRKENPEAFRNELKKNLEAARIRLQQQQKQREAPPIANQPDNAQRRPMVRLMEHLKEKRPEVYERLDHLRKDNPEAFKEELLKLAQKVRIERGLPAAGDAPRRQEAAPSGTERDSPIRPTPSPDYPRDTPPPEAKLNERLREESARLARAYRTAEGESDRRAIREKAEILAERYVDEMTRHDREQAARLEEQLQDLRRKIENRRRERDEWRRHLVERILGDRAA